MNCRALLKPSEGLHHTKKSLLKDGVVEHEQQGNVGLIMGLSGPQLSPHTSEVGRYAHMHWEGGQEAVQRRAVSYEDKYPETE